MKLRNIATALLLGATAMGASALEPTWHVDFSAVFDNREGSNKFTDTKTFIFTNLGVEAGLRFTANDRISGGAVWHQPIGCQWDGHRLSPTLYYRHEASGGKGWSFSMGMFPRTQLREEMPGFLWSDSLSYTQSNIRGMLVQYAHKRGYFDFYLDWRGLQTEKQREAFNIVFHGQWHPRAGNPFFLGGHVMMNHFALTKHSDSSQHIVDNFVAAPHAGVNLQGRTPLDSLIFRAGPLLTMERDRGDMKWHTPIGGWIQGVAEWKWLGVKEEFYFGGRQMPNYIPHRSLLYQGEPFYQAKTMSRTDVYANIIRNRWMKLRAGLDFIVADSEFTFYQRVMLTINLPGPERQGSFRKK